VRDERSFPLSLSQTPHDLVTILSIPSSFFPDPTAQTARSVYLQFLTFLLWKTGFAPGLKEQRRKGEKGLEIMFIQNKPCIYSSTSVCDGATRSPKKVSTCIGRPTKGDGLIPKGSRGSSPTSPAGVVRDYGSAALMAEGFGDTCCRFSRTLSRYVGRNLSLSRVADVWDKLDNILDINPDCDSRIPSLAIAAVGGDRTAQQIKTHSTASPQPLQQSPFPPPGMSTTRSVWNREGRAGFFFPPDR